MSEKVRRKLTPLGVMKIMFWSSFAVGVVLGLLQVFARRAGVDLPSELVGLIALLVLLMVVVGGIVGGVAYWRVLDEAAREAHKFAWWWGGTFGGLAAVIVAVFLPSQTLTAMFGGLSVNACFLLGMVALMSAQVIGYCLAWAGWWLARR